MPSKIELVNRALSELGKLPIAKIEDSEASIFLSNKIDELHPELLLVTNWLWAITYKSDSTPLISNFSPDYSYSYQLPSNFGKFFRFINASTDYAYYMFADGMILSNSNPIQYYYIVNDVDYSIIPALYARALILYAAASCSLNLTNNVQLTGYLDNQYKLARIRAILQNDMERSVQQMPYNDYGRKVYV